MLAEALCKLEGFKYEPSDSIYWQHGRSTETDFIYVTTANLSHAQLTQLSGEVGPDTKATGLLAECAAPTAADSLSRSRSIPAFVLSKAFFKRVVSADISVVICQC